MLLNEFDSNKKAVFNITDFVKTQKDFPKTVLGLFHQNLISEFIKIFNPEKIAEVKSYTTNFEIYQINYKGTKIAVTLMPLGSPYAVEIFEELIALGAKNLLTVGSCGCLEPSYDSYSIIIPSSALRDEGTSFHYQPESDEIELDSEIVNILETTISGLGISVSKGKTWTTDALYRETEAKVAKRKSQGAIVVDMECSALCACAKFREVKFGQFFYGADNLGKEEYDIRTLVDEDVSQQAKIIPIALECAKNIDEKF